MRPLRWGLALILGLGLAGFTVAFAQTAPVPQPTCEQRLEESQASILQLRKQLAQSQFQAAAVEEIAISCQKKAASEAPKPAAKAPAPDVGKK